MISKSTLMNNRGKISRSASRAQLLDQGRESFRKQKWGSAFSQLSEADKLAPLEGEGLVEFAQAALLLGRDAEGGDILARAHQSFLNLGETRIAARTAFWLGFTSLLNGEFAKAGGWLSRAERLLDGHPDCAEKGYLLLPTGYRSFHGGDPATAHGMFVRAAAIGELFGDRDLSTLGLQGQGRALIRQGEIAKGVTLLDEAMIAVTAGEVSSLTAGGVYCSVLDACGEIFDLKRAQEWTLALEKWCASQPDLVPYRGHCLVRRAELMQLHGAWPDALAEAQKATEWLSRPLPKAEAGSAFYCLGEIHRLRGAFTEAEEAYRLANQWNRVARPGLALLRLAQGQLDAATAAIQRIVEDVHEPGIRALVLDAYVEILLAANDVQAARTAADELASIAGLREVPFLCALASRACGAVLLAEHNARLAFTTLRQSWTIWCELNAPYEAARTRVLIAIACRELGDEDAAVLELGAALKVFTTLGAIIEISRVKALLNRKVSTAAGSLTMRELQVLRLVASGMTNRGIAGGLQISEKTVARHISNIFNKLDLSSRAAATAYAYQQDLF